MSRIALSGDAAGTGTFTIASPNSNSNFTLTLPAESGTIGVNSSPAGTVIFYAANTAPSGYLKANGANVSRTTYAALFAAIGTTFGAGDGSTTFTLPDLRGEFPRGWDDGRGVDSGRAFGSTQANGIPRLRGGVTDSHGNSAMSAFDVGGFTNPFVNAGGNSSWRTQIEAVTTAAVYVEFDSARVITSATEVRPRNLALLACIKF